VLAQQRGSGNLGREAGELDRAADRKVAAALLLLHLDHGAAGAQGRSLAISFMESTGAQGTSNLRRMSTASNLVLLASHFSISAKISKMWGWRARAVA